MDAMRKWLADNGYTEKQPAVRSLLERWTIYEENEEFLLNPPGRMRFFGHLMTRNHCYGPHMSGPLRAINWFNAFGSLLTGYEHFHLLDRWRVAATGFLKRLPTRAALPRQKDNRPGTGAQTDHDI